MRAIRAGFRVKGNKFARGNSTNFGKFENNEGTQEVTMEQASGTCANVKRQEFCIMDVMAKANLEVADDPL
jgi:hypothetical protein